MTLEAAVKKFHPTILVGTSTTPKTFTPEIVEEMTAHTPRPIIFPLSNPTELAEDLLRRSNGKALVATGIPAQPVEFDGVTYEIGQANNALIYLGLGLGVIAVKVSRLTEQMISRAAHSLGGIVYTKKPAHPSCLRSRNSRSFQASSRQPSQRKLADRNRIDLKLTTLQSP